VLILALLCSNTVSEGFQLSPIGSDEPVGRKVCPVLSSSSATETRSATKVIEKNPRYPDYSFDKYLANPYFAKINTAYPGLQLIHEEPFIFIVNDFLSSDECTRLIGKAEQGSLRAQIGGGGVVRTSQGVVCMHEEVPTIQSKLMDLVQVPHQGQLQYLKVSRYGAGDTFSKHTDAWPTEGAPISKGWVEAPDFFGDRLRPTKGCMSSKNQPNHNTIFTTFVYLNTVEKGGATAFPNLGLHTGKNGHNFYENPTPMDTHCRPDGSRWDWEYRTEAEPLQISPQRGMAVLHFCSLLPEYGGICDGNTFHVAEPPAEGHEKFVAQQFVASCIDWALPDDSIPLGRVSWDTI
jgi:hypothetical protein